MSAVLDQLQPAPPKDVNVYLPYYKEAHQRNLLPMAISLYKQGSFEGQRSIEGGENIPFLATWSISPLPADMSRCNVQFDGNPDFSYEVMMNNFHFVSYLIEVITNYKRGGIPDFSKGFYRRLLRLED